jgi:hypothetical protein
LGGRCIDFRESAKLPVPLFSYLLFELKQALDCFEHCKLLGGQLVYYPKGFCKSHTVQDLSLLIWAVVVLIFVVGRNYQYHSSATAYSRLKQALDCFEHCSFWAGSWCTPKGFCKNHTVQDLSLLI